MAERQPHSRDVSLLTQSLASVYLAAGDEARARALLVETMSSAAAEEQLGRIRERIEAAQDR